MKRTEAEHRRRWWKLKEEECLWGDLGWETGAFGGEKREPERMKGEEVKRKRRRCADSYLL